MSIDQRKALAAQYGTNWIYVVPTNSFAAWGYTATGRERLAKGYGNRGGSWTIFGPTTSRQRETQGDLTCKP